MTVLDFFYVLLAAIVAFLYGHFLYYSGKVAGRNQCDKEDAALSGAEARPPTKKPHCCFCFSDTWWVRAHDVNAVAYWAEGTCAGCVTARSANIEMLFDGSGHLTGRASGSVAVNGSQDMKAALRLYDTLINEPYAATTKDAEKEVQRFYPNFKALQGPYVPSEEHDSAESFYDHLLVSEGCTSMPDAAEREVRWWWPDFRRPK